METSLSHTHHRKKTLAGQFLKYSQSHRTRLPIDMLVYKYIPFVTLSLEASWQLDHVSYLDCQPDSHLDCPETTVKTKCTSNCQSLTPPPPIYIYMYPTMKFKRQHCNLPQISKHTLCHLFSNSSTALYQEIISFVHFKQQNNIPG